MRRNGSTALATSRCGPAPATSSSSAEDDQVKINGFRVELGEVSCAFADPLSGIADAIVTVHHGAQVCAFGLVRGARDAAGRPGDDLGAACGRLPAHLRPRRVTRCRTSRCCPTGNATVRRFPNQCSPSPRSRRGPSVSRRSAASSKTCWTSPMRSGRRRPLRPWRGQPARPSGGEPARGLWRDDPDQGAVPAPHPTSAGRRSRHPRHCRGTRARRRDGRAGRLARSSPTTNSLVSPTGVPSRCRTCGHCRRCSRASTTSPPTPTTSTPYLAQNVFDFDRQSTLTRCVPRSVRFCPATTPAGRLHQ